MEYARVGKNKEDKKSDAKKRIEEELTVAAKYKEPP